jgi:hypothetical protein
MLWLLGRIAGPPESADRKRLVLAACDCAELALPHVRDEWVRSIAEATLEVTRAWAHDSQESARVREARSLCWSAAADAAAAYAAADAADAAAAYAAADAADAAAAAAYAADASAASAARRRVLKQCADIVRAHYPVAPVVKS